MKYLHEFVDAFITGIAWGIGFSLAVKLLGLHLTVSF